MPSARKVTTFHNSQGVLLAHFQKCGENVNFASYCEVLLKLWDAIHRELPGVVLHHDNARPHTAQATQERIQELQWELTPDFKLIDPLKTTFVANVSLMTRLKWRFGSSRDNRKTSMLQVSTHW
jgi:hypothetical protein